MDDGNGKHRHTGRFLARTEQRGIRCRRWLMVTMLLIWDGMLLYMIINCLIVPVYGAVFVAVISIYLGYQL